MATSGLASGIRWRASAAVDASPTTVISTSDSRSERMPSRTNAGRRAGRPKSAWGRCASLCAVPIQRSADAQDNWLPYGLRRPSVRSSVPYTRVNDPEKLRRLMAAVLMLTADVELHDLLSHFVDEARGWWTLATGPWVS